MQIAGLSQCFNRQKVVKTRKKRGDVSIMPLTTVSYESCSKLAYLRPTLPLVVFTRVLRDTL